jgi:hypothetical protein
MEDKERKIPHGHYLVIFYKNIITKFTYLSKICYGASIQDPEALLVLLAPYKFAWPSYY